MSRHAGATRFKMPPIMKTSLPLRLTLLLACCCAAPAAAQTDAGEQHDIQLPADTLAATPQLSLPFPDFSMSAPGLDGCSPFFYGRYGSLWQLHEGFNAQLSLSLSTGFGKGAFKGVGFGESAAFAYALPLGKRVSFAAGVYATNMDWGRWRQTEAGVAGILSFKVNESINLYAYGAKSFFPRQEQLRRAPVPPFLRNVGDRIGAMAEFKVGRNAIIQVSMEHHSE